jgi:putative DNA primase/helicase
MLGGRGGAMPGAEHGDGADNTGESKDAKRQFLQAMARRRLELAGDLVADGNLQRCNAGNKDGHSGRGDGSYILHLDGYPAGGFKNWTDGRGWEDWKYKLARPLTATEREEW